MSPEQRMTELGLELPEAVRPLASYVPAVRTGRLVYVSGQVPLQAGRLTLQGKLGAGVTVEQAQAAARVCVLNCLAAVRGLTGSLDNITRIVKLTGYVASAEGFTEQPQVVNGASQLLEEIFGEAGQHARAAVGVAELPLGAPVEIELIVEVE